MQAVPQIEPITRLARDHVALVRAIAKGPVYLTQKTVPTAVLVSVKDWNASAALIADLRTQLRRERALRQAAQAKAGDQLISPEQYTKLLGEAGLDE